MKNSVIFLAVILIASSAAAQEYQIDQTEYFDCMGSIPGAGQADYSVAKMPCIYKNEGDCNRAKDAMIAARGETGQYCAKRYKCVPCGGSGGASGGTWQDQLVKGLIGLIFKKKDPQQAEIERQNALRRQQEEEQKKREEEQRRQAGNQAWADLQSQYQRQKEIEAKSKQEAGQDLLGKMDTVGGGGELKFKTVGTDFFGTSKPTDVTLQGKEEGGYPTSGFTEMEALRASAYFFAGALDAAVNSGDYDKAAYLGIQADRVIQKRPTSSKVDFAALPDIPMPSAPERVHAGKLEVAGLLQEFQKSLNSLLDVEVRLIETKAKIKEAEEKKEKARVKLEEVKQVVAVAKPEEKPNADALAAQAQALLDGANEELEEAKRSESDMAREKGQYEARIREMDAKIKGGGK